MSAFLKLIRLPNLLIIVLTQYAVRWGIIFPMLKGINIYLNTNYPELIKADVLTLQMSEFQFFLLSLSTVMVAAAGYIINDYFDVKIDRINKPKKLVIDRGIKRRVAMAAHVVISFLAIGIGFMLAYKIGMWKLGMIYILCTAGLWYYSTSFKYTFLVGNLVIAIFTALVPLIVGLFEIPLLVQKYAILVTQFDVSFNHIFYFIVGFSFFAFITTLIREIIKDIYDMEGDREFGCNTMPIALGIAKTKYIVMGLTVLTMIALGYLQYLQFNSGDKLSFFYLLVFIQAPFLLLIYKTFRANEPKEFHFPETLTKIIMILGVLYTVVIYYSLLIQ